MGEREIRRTATAVVQRMSHRDDSIVCRRSGIRLKPSCRDRSEDTILRSAVVLSFCYDLSRPSSFTTGVSSRW